MPTPSYFTATETTITVIEVIRLFLFPRCLKSPHNIKFMFVYEWQTLMDKLV